MGLLDMFGAGSSPFASWVKENPYAVQGLSSTLSNVGGGLVGASNLHDALGGVSRSLTAGHPDQAAYLQAMQQQQKDAAAAQAEQAKQNATIEWLKATAPKYAEAVANGAMSPGDAFKAALTDASPKAPIKASPGDVFLDPTDYHALASVPPKPPAAPVNYRWAADGKSLEPIPGGAADDSGDAGAIADAIARGEQPPTTTGLYHLAGPVRANLAKKGYDLTKAVQDYGATTRLLASMNGPQQLRLRQAVEFTKESLPVIEQLAKEWNAGGFPVLNKVVLEAAKNGALGPAAQSVATRLATQINDMTAELGTVYKGGNSSTDESLKLAASNLDANWSEATLLDAIKMIRQNIVYRENSLNSVATAGFPASTYNPMGAPPTAPGTTFRYNPDTGELEPL